MYFKTKLRKIIVVFVSIGLWLWPLSVKAQDVTDRQISWKNFETGYTVVQYQKTEDLIRFDRQIDFSVDRGGIKSLFSSDSKYTALSIKKKMDAIYLRVQEILDMRKKMKKIVIKIYPKNQFGPVRYKKTRSDHPIRSWYIYEENTIYINVDDVHEGILAHEIAHAVIDHYMLVRPPRATAEILAAYVDKNLFY
ncbi:MAG: hypothetical protein ABII68_02400 [Pseudomonadota bacterium]